MKLEVMRDQFRARNAVYKCEKGSIPAIGKGTEVEESERVEREVRVLVEKELPGKKGCPLPLTLRTAHDAPTAEALKQDRQYVQAIVHATQEFLFLVRGHEDASPRVDAEEEDDDEEEEQGGRG